MPRKTISLDLRERIVAAYDNDEGTQQEVAHRFKVSWDFVKKLFKQRRRTGDIAARHRFSGRKPLILPLSLKINRCNGGGRLRPHAVATYSDSRGRNPLFLDRQPHPSR
jgi:hypothetical protein